MRHALGEVSDDLAPADHWITYAKDWDATRAWYDELRTEDGTRVIGGSVANIVGNPVG